MSIYILRSMLADVPNGKKVTMRYEEGGKFQVFTLGDVSVTVGPDATLEEVKTLLLEALAQQ